MGTSMMPDHSAANAKAIFNYRMRQMAGKATPAGLIRFIQKTPQIKME